ncbi:MAG: PepSY domain-containing protein [Pseudomonadales bacterium]
MTIRTLPFLFMLLGSLFCSAAVYADARQHDWHPGDRLAAANRSAITVGAGYPRMETLLSSEVSRPAYQRTAGQAGRSMSEAIAIAKARVPGELVSASKKIGRDGDVVYHVKILSRKGVVRTVRVPANSD